MKTHWLNDMGFKEFLLANALIQTLKYAKKRGVIKKVANKVDSLADDHFKKRSENVQEKVVKLVLLPLCRELMIENPDRMLQIMNEFIDEEE